MPNPTDNFEKDEVGNVILKPIIGWEAFTPHQMACGLRLEYVTSEEDLSLGRSLHFQTVMTPVQARALADTLQKMADHVENAEVGKQN